MKVQVVSDKEEFNSIRLGEAQNCHNKPQSQIDAATITSQQVGEVHQNKEQGDEKQAGAKGQTNICQTLFQDEKRKYFTVSASAILLSTLIFIIGYFTVLTEPTKVWKDGRQLTYIIDTKDCVKNVETIPNLERNSYGDCYELQGQVNLYTHGFNNTHGIQYFQVTNLTQTFENGTVFYVDKFIPRIGRQLSEQAKSIIELGLEYINKLGNGKIVSDKQSGHAVEISIPNDTHPIVFQVVFQLLQHTNTEFLEDDAPSNATIGSLTSLSQQVNVNQKTKQSSRRQYLKGTKTVTKEAVAKEDNDLSQVQVTVFNSEGQAISSNIDANRSITQKFDNLTISLEGKTTQSIKLISEIFVGDDVIKYQKELLKLQTLVTYDHQNISKAGVKQQQADPIEVVNNKSEGVEGLPGGRLLADVMEGSKDIMITNDWKVYSKLVLNTFIEQRVDISVQKLKEAGKYRIAMFLKEYINNIYTRMLHPIDKIIDLNNPQVLPWLDIFQTRMFETSYPLGGINLNVYVISVIERQSYAKQEYDKQHNIYFYIGFNQQGDSNGNAFLSVQSAEAGISINGMLFNLEFNLQLIVTPTSAQVVSYLGQGSELSVQAFKREQICQLGPVTMVIDEKVSKPKEACGQFPIIGRGGIPIGN